MPEHPRARVTEPGRRAAMVLAAALAVVWLPISERPAHGPPPGPGPTAFVFQAEEGLDTYGLAALGLSVEVRQPGVWAAPASPPDEATMAAVAAWDRAHPSARWLAAPADRAYPGTRRLARAGLVAGVIGVLLLGAGTTRGVLQAAVPALALAWWLAPGPLGAVLLPLAIASALRVVRTPSLLVRVAMVTAWVPLLWTGAGWPALAAGTLCLVAPETEQPGPVRPSPPAARALALLLLGAAVIALVRPAAVDPTWLDPVPRVASTEPVEQVRRALDATGLGPTVEDGGVLFVPLEDPSVEPALRDTARAASGGPVPWRSATGQQPSVPWGLSLAWGALLLVAIRALPGHPRQAIAAVLPAGAAVLGWLLEPSPPGLLPVLAASALAVPAGRGSLGVLLGAALAPLALGWSGPLVAAFLAVATARWLAPAVAAGAWPGRAGRRVAEGALFGALVALHLDVLLLLATAFAPPSAPERADEPIVTSGNASSLGQARLVRAHGVWVLSTRGDPYEIGYTAGALADPLRVRLEDELFASFTRSVPKAPARWLITRASAFLGRDLDQHLLPRYRLELAGDVDAAPERFWFGGPTYTRKVWYHAIHDVGQAVVDTPLLGCTGFVAGPVATADGHWRLARAFDFDGGVAFDRDKVIRVNAPDDRIPYLSVAFAGMLGAVSGVNRDGLAVVINASGSDDPPRPGTPMTLIVREILESASSLDEAEAILEDRKGFVSENVMVVDADAGEAALFETTPRRVVRVAVDGTLAFSNHFRSDAFTGDSTNARRKVELTTVPRLLRAEELVERHFGRIDDETAARILSDRSGVGDAALPRGHRHALNADIATHGVVIDVTARRVWVSVYPNLSGGWVSLDLEAALKGDLEPRPEVTASPDAWRAVRLRRARELLRLARRARAGDAVALAERALELAPDHPEALFELGLRLSERGDPRGAELLRRAEATPVEYAHQQHAIDEVLR